jgi:aminoglycoside N3'-acetyltransferase
VNNSLVKKWKKRIKSKLRELQLWHEKTFYPFGQIELETALSALGIQSGDTVFVHSSFDACKGFRGKPSDILNMFQGLVGEKGIIMMPTMAFTGTAVEYALQNPSVDIRRVQSRMGLITELFRRMPGVARSPHPTHPIAVWGDDAQALVAGHHLAQTPCGSPSPLQKMLARNGKIVLLGTGFDVLTFYHTIEEILENSLPVNPFTDRFFALQVKDEQGQTWDCHTRLYEPSVSTRRRLGRIMEELRRMGVLGERRVGRLNIQVFFCQDVLKAVQQLLARGISCYE